MSGDALRPGNRLACPRCLSPDHLFENVQGWRDIGGVRIVGGSRIVDRPGYRVEDPEHISYGCANTGCNVDHEIAARLLVQLDFEGKPVVPEPAEQGRLV